MWSIGALDLQINTENSSNSQLLTGRTFNMTDEHNPKSIAVVYLYAAWWPMSKPLKESIVLKSKATRQYWTEYKNVLSRKC